VYNYDESNLQGDPSSKKAFICEKVCDKSKDISVMFCASADRAMVPPMTLYQSTTKVVYDTWSEGGPDGFTYATTKRGWIDTNSFNR